MFQQSLAAEREQAVKEKARRLFADGTLGDKTSMALALSEMSGLDLFLTPVPWRITLPDGQAFKGRSENLEQAAKDIHSKLFVLSETLPSDTPVAIGIDEERLTAPRRQSERTQGG